jgi:putative ABC transport system ATP-binding protein
LILDPKLILADEPTGNLDSKNGQAILDLLVDLNKAGHSIVLVTHDTKAGHTAKRIVTMQDGQIVSDEVMPPPAPHMLTAHHEHH